MENTSMVEAWLNTHIPKTRKLYSRFFKMFEEYVGKTGDEMLREHRDCLKDFETINTYPEKVFQFYRYLLTEVKAAKLGGARGKRGGWTGQKSDKPLSQHTAHSAITAVQSFFNYYNLSINLKKFLKKDVRMKKPKADKKKHQLIATEINEILKAGSPKEKAIVALGLMGQDESTITSLRIEQFAGKLGKTKLEFVELTRPKTNTDILLVLTPEVQEILATYITSLGKQKGWLFNGYGKRHMTPERCNAIFKALCAKANVQALDKKRLSFHCCRMSFSSQLRNRISDDTIDLLTGHEVRYDGAYLGSTEKVQQPLEESNITELLKLQSNGNGIKKELNETKGRVQEQSDIIAQQTERINKLEATLLTYQEAQAQLINPKNQEELMAGITKLLKAYGVNMEIKPKA